MADTAWAGRLAALCDAYAAIVAELQKPEYRRVDPPEAPRLAHLTCPAAPLVNILDDRQLTTAMRSAEFIMNFIGEDAEIKSRGRLEADYSAPDFWQIATAMAATSQRAACIYIHYMWDKGSVLAGGATAVFALGTDPGAALRLAKFLHLCAGNPRVVYGLLSQAVADLYKTHTDCGSECVVRGRSAECCADACCATHVGVFATWLCWVVAAAGLGTTQTQPDTTRWISAIAANLSKEGRVRVENICTLRARRMLLTLGARLGFWEACCGAAHASVAAPMATPPVLWEISLLARECRRWLGVRRGVFRQSSRAAHEKVLGPMAFVGCRGDVDGLAVPLQEVSPRSTTRHYAKLISQALILSFTHMENLPKIADALRVHLNASPDTYVGREYWGDSMLSVLHTAKAATRGRMRTNTHALHQLSLVVLHTLIQAGLIDDATLTQFGIDLEDVRRRCSEIMLDSQFLQKFRRVDTLQWAWQDRAGVARFPSGAFDAI